MMTLLIVVNNFNFKFFIDIIFNYFTFILIFSCRISVSYVYCMYCQFPKFRLSGLCTCTLVNAAQSWVVNRFLCLYDQFTLKN